MTLDALPPAPEVLAAFGFRVRPVTGGRDEGSGIEIDQVVTGSPAFLAGLRPGMRILDVGREPVATVGQFEAADRQARPEAGPASRGPVDRRPRG